MNHTFTRVVSLIMGALILVYIGFQAYRAYYKPYPTETANTYTQPETLDAEVFAVRKEQYVFSSNQGYLLDRTEDGGKVSKDGVLALAFPSQENVTDYLRLEEIQKEINSLNSLTLMKNASGLLDLDFINRDINAAVNEAETVIESGDLKSLSYYESELLKQLNKHQLVTGQLHSFEDKLSTLRDEQQQILQKPEITKTEILSPLSGYFISRVDGYEETVDYDTVRDLQYDQVAAYIASGPAAVPPDCIGKVVSEFDWYLICNVDLKRMPSLSTGTVLSINLPLSGVDALPVTVERFYSSDMQKGTLILSCNLMNERLSNLRKETGQIVLKQHNGLRIGKSAIRMVDGVQGAYVLTGNKVSFKTVKILYEGDEDDYVIVELNNDRNSIKLYDNVIMRGKDLYDGKIMR